MQNLDEMEDEVEREKKNKSEIEKAKRKLEGDLRCSQEAASELERSKVRIWSTSQNSWQNYGQS